MAHCCGILEICETLLVVFSDPSGLLCLVEQLRDLGVLVQLLVFL